MLTAQELDQMCTAEKLLVMEAIWRSLDPDEIPSPAWHEEVLRERERLVESGKATYIPLREVQASLERELN